MAILRGPVHIECEALATDTRVGSQRYRGPRLIGYSLQDERNYYLILFVSFMQIVRGPPTEL